MNIIGFVYNLTIRKPPLLEILAFHLEGLLLSYCAWNCVRNLLFCLHCFALIGFAAVHYLAHLNAWLDAALVKYRIGLSTQFQFARAVDHFRVECSILLLDAIESNRHLVSPICLAAIVANFPMSIYLAVERLFMSGVILAGDQLIDIVFIGLQFAFVLLASLPMIRIANCAFALGKPLFRVQFYLRAGPGIGAGGGGDNLSKLKLLSILERAYCDQRRFAYTLGPFGKITRRFIAEVSSLKWPMLPGPGPINSPINHYIYVSNCQALLCYTSYLMVMYGFFQREMHESQMIRFN